MTIKSKFRRGLETDCIISAAMSSGNPLFVSVSGTTLTLLGATTPFVVDVKGRRCVVNTDAVTLALTDDAHNFVYFDRNGGAYQLGRSAVPPRYSYETPGAPSTDDYWYDLGAMAMKKYSGSAWVEVEHVFIGYVRMDSGAATISACEPVGAAPLWRFQNFGNGSDGFLDISSGTTSITGIKQYTAVACRGTATIQHVDAGSIQLKILCQGIFALMGTSGVNLDTLGVGGRSGGTGAGGAGFGNGSAPGGGGGGGTNAGGAGGTGVGPTNTGTYAGGAGGGAGAAGSAGVTTTGTVGYAVKDSWVPCLGAGGGAGGGDGASNGGNGGDGGGGIFIWAASIAVGSSALLVARGGNGQDGGGANRGAGGGGGGGCILLVYRSYVNSGTVSVAGGSGGASGGAGSGAGGAGGAGHLQTVRI